MLVLTRRLGETIVIGDDIVIKIVDIHGKQIRVGIEAPSEISVYRGEIYERIMQENKAAAEAADVNTDAIEENVKKILVEKSTNGDKVEKGS
ncbi:MAG: carbon storage regulator CsrA [candidate division KSB1 bacterium]|nr:carbon storage regulator CsrA [candidate division KSB1 bacterium]MDQ7062669.1 carbon storage regulator CsrA [candidate division KSB1 bacterium]